MGQTQHCANLPKLFLYFEKQETRLDGMVTMLKMLLFRENVDCMDRENTYVNSLEPNGRFVVDHRQHKFLLVAKMLG